MFCGSAFKIYLYGRLVAALNIFSMLGCKINVQKKLAFFLCQENQFRKYNGKNAIHI
jgi:hypothetical protein